MENSSDPEGKLEGTMQDTSICTEVLHVGGLLVFELQVDKEVSKSVWPHDEHYIHICHN